MGVVLAGEIGGSVGGTAGAGTVAGTTGTTAGGVTAGQVSTGAVAGEAAGGGATGAAAGTTSGDAFSAISSGSSLLGGAEDLLMGQIDDAMQWTAAIKNFKEQKRQFDKAFEENKRQFGLEFALREWATRKGIELQEAQIMYNRAIQAQNMQMQKSALRENIKSSSLARSQLEKQMKWQEEDRTNKIQLEKSYSTGLLSGILGRE